MKRYQEAGGTSGCAFCQKRQEEIDTDRRFSAIEEALSLSLSLSCMFSNKGRGNKKRKQREKHRSERRLVTLYPMVFLTVPSLLFLLSFVFLSVFLTVRCAALSSVLDL